METAERIVETYVRCVKRWATITNVECDGGREIDIIAIGTMPQDRYHIEVSGTIDPAWRTLTAAVLRDCLGKKFNDPNIQNKLGEYGLLPGQYRKVVVIWSWNQEAQAMANEKSVILWALPQVLREVSQFVAHRTEAFTDEILRTLQLLSCAGLLQANVE